MACKRNRSVILAEYISSLGLEVNLKKNKARGNKGFFANKNGVCRIDISKNLSELEMIEVLVHEFAHYFHFTQDKTLKSLEFIFGKYNDDFLNELIEITVLTVPKDNARDILTQKESLKRDIEDLIQQIKNVIPNFNKQIKDKKLEKEINKTDLKFLLKYDNVKVLKYFSVKLYSIKNIDKEFKDVDEVLRNYVKLQSKQRMLKRVNSRISRLNKYYNSPTELFARAFSLYATNKELITQKAPNVKIKLDNAMEHNQFKLLKNILEIIE